MCFQHMECDEISCGNTLRGTLATLCLIYKISLEIHVLANFGGTFVGTYIKKMQNMLYKVEFTFLSIGPGICLNKFAIL